MAKTVVANGKTFTFDDEATNEQIGDAIDEYFSGQAEPLKKKEDTNISATEPSAPSLIPVQEPSESIGLSSLSEAKINVPVGERRVQAQSIVRPSVNAGSIQMYEQTQSNLSDIDKKISKYNEPLGISFGKDYVEELNKKRNIIQKSSDFALKAVKDDLDKISNNINYKEFLKKDISGFDVPDEAKISEYASKVSSEAGVSDSGYFKKLLYNDIKSKIAYKNIEPDVNQKFDELYKQKFGESKESKEQKMFISGMKGVDDIKLQVESQINNLNSELKSAINGEISPFVEQYKKNAALLNTDIKVKNSQIEQEAKNIRIAYENKQISFEDAKRILSELEGKAERQYKDYQDAFKIANDGLLDFQNKVNTKFNAQYNRQAREIQNIANEKIKQKIEDYQSKYQLDPKYLAEVKKIYGQANNDVLKSHEGLRKYFGDKGYGGMAGQWISSYLSTIGRTLSGYSSELGWDTGEVLGDRMSSYFYKGEGNIESLKDLLDPSTLTLSTAQLAGGMTASMGAGITVAAITKSPSVGIRTAVSGVASWFAESVDMAGNAKRDVFAQTGDAEKANKAERDTWSTQVLLAPTYALEMLPFIEGGLKMIRNKFLKTLTGAGIEYVSEFMQEYPQNIFEANIREGRDPFDIKGLKQSKGQDILTEQFKQTALNLIPLMGIGAFSQLKEKHKYTDKEIAELWANSQRTKGIVGKSTPYAQNQMIANAVIDKGENFAKTITETLFANGTITEEVKNNYLTQIEKTKGVVESVKQLGLTTDDAKAYGALMDISDGYLKQADATPDANAKAILIDKSAKAKENAIQILNRQEADYAVIEYQNGEKSVLSHEELSNLMDNPAIVDLYQNKKIKLSIYGDAKFFNDKIEELNKNIQNKRSLWLIDAINDMDDNEQIQFLEKAINDELNEDGDKIVFSDEQKRYFQDKINSLRSQQEFKELQTNVNIQQPMGEGEDNLGAVGDVSKEGKEVSKEEVLGTPDEIKTIPTSDLNLDPNRFQYKVENREATGATGSIDKDVPFNKQLAGVVSVWLDPKDGKTYVVNGHNRTAKAKSAGVETMNVMYIDAKSPEEARAIGALQNIADGKGTAVDAAKYFRDTNSTPEDLKGQGISVKKGIGQQGLALSKLAKPLFDLVAQGRMSVERGVLIGGANSESAQKSIYEKIKQIEGSGAIKMKNSTIKEYVDAANVAPKEKVTITDLFGTTEEEQVDIDTRMELLGDIRERLIQDKNVFGVAAKKADILNEAGNQIDAAMNEGISKEAAQTLGVFDLLKNTSPELNKIINNAVKNIKDAKTRAEKTRAKNDAYEAIRTEVPRIIEGGKREGSEGVQKDKADRGQGSSDLTPKTKEEAPALSDVESTAKALEDKEKTFTNTPSLKDANAVSIIDANLSAIEETNAIDVIVENNKGDSWNKALRKNAENVGNGWFRIGKTMQGESILHSPYKNETVVIKGAKIDGIAVQDFIKNNFGNPQNTAEAYHKAKADGSNPELVKAVESLLSKEQAPPALSDVESTAKDDKGVPINEGKWYHGTPIEGLSGNELKPNKNGLIFFTRDKGIAERYATNDYEGNTKSNNVFERKLEVNNIFDPEKNSNNSEIIDLLASKGNFENAGRNADFDALAKEALENGEWSVLETKEFIDGLKKLGYDAIYIDNRPYYAENSKGERTFNRDIAVFDTKQHKAVESLLSKEQSPAKEEAPSPPALRDVESFVNQFEMKGNREYPTIDKTKKLVTKLNTAKERLKGLNENPEETLGLSKNSKEFNYALKKTKEATEIEIKETEYKIDKFKREISKEAEANGLNKTDVLQAVESLLSKEQAPSALRDVELKYNDKGEHLAPNGKPSKLSENHAKLVRTKEFKEWFGDWENDTKNASKVLDENGEPLLLYHGTNAEFDQFDTKFTKGGAERVHKFTTSKEAAKEYGKNIIQVFLRIDDKERGTKWESKKGLAKWEMGGKTFDKARLDLVYESKKSNEANGGVIKNIRSNDGKIEMDVYYTENTDNIKAVESLLSKEQAPVSEPTPTQKLISDAMGIFYELKDGKKSSTERRILKEKMNEMLSKSPKIKYIFDNIQDINKELGDNIKKRGDC